MRFYIMRLYKELKPRQPFSRTGKYRDDSNIFMHTKTKIMWNRKHVFRLNAGVGYSLFWQCGPLVVVVPALFLHLTIKSLDISKTWINQSSTNRRSVVSRPLFPVDTTHLHLACNQLLREAILRPTVTSSYSTFSSS